MVLGISITVHTSFNCFTYIASVFFQDRFGYNEVQAGSIMRVGYFTAGLSCPLVGFITDKIGKRVIMIIISSICVTGFHVLCMMTSDTYQPVYPIFYLVVLGFGYSIYVTVYWAALSYIVEPRFYGTVIGTTFAISNLGLVIFPLILEYLIDNTTQQDGYFWGSFLLAILASLGGITGVIVYYLDMKKGGVLHSKDPYSAKQKFKLLNQSKIPEIIQEYSIN